MRFGVAITLSLTRCRHRDRGTGVLRRDCMQGVVGDFLGACVAASEIVIYLLLRLDVCVQHRALLADEVLGSLLVLAATVSGVLVYLSLIHI